MILDPLNRVLKIIQFDPSIIFEAQLGFFQEHIDDKPLLLIVPVFTPLMDLYISPMLPLYIIDDISSVL